MSHRLHCYTIATHPAELSGVKNVGEATGGGEPPSKPKTGGEGTGEHQPPSTTTTAAGDISAHRESTQVPVPNPRSLIKNASSGAKKKRTKKQKSRVDQEVETLESSPFPSARRSRPGGLGLRGSAPKPQRFIPGNPKSDRSNKKRAADVPVKKKKTRKKPNRHVTYDQRPPADTLKKAPAKKKKAHQRPKKTKPPPDEKKPSARKRVKVLAYSSVVGNRKSDTVSTTNSKKAKIGDVLSHRGPGVKNQATADDDVGPKSNEKAPYMYQGREVDYLGYDAEHPKMVDWVESNIDRRGIDYRRNRYRTVSFFAKQVNGQWTRWIGFNPQEFGGDGGVLCQDCGLGLTINSWSKHTRAKCPYWKERKRLGVDEDPVVMEVAKGWNEGEQDGFSIVEGGADSSSGSGSQASSSEYESSDESAGRQGEEGEGEEGEEEDEEGIDNGEDGER